MINCPKCNASVEGNVYSCPYCSFVFTKKQNSQTHTTHVITDVMTDLNNVFQDDGLLTQESLPLTQIIDTSTQIQSCYAILTHVQTNVVIELPSHLPVIHLGKPNETTPPDIDISGFPHSQIVSRIHADILQQRDNFYIEDTGSANGTYINHAPLPPGNRHRLKSGDRIALGKEDKVSFIFKLVRDIATN